MLKSLNMQFEITRPDGSQPLLTEEDIARIAALFGGAAIGDPDIQCGGAAERKQVEDPVQAEDPVLEAIDQAERTLIPALESLDDCKQVIQVVRNLRENHKQLLLYKQGWRTPGDE